MNRTFLFLLLLPLFGQAQTTPSPTEESRSRFITKGGLTGIGNTFSANTKYDVYFFMGDYSHSFGEARKNDFVSWYAQPQFNLVNATNTKGIDVELGINLGIRNYVRLSDRLYFYQQLGAGPHYFSARLDRQARGFIFSDNLDLGFLIRAGKGLINLQGGLRHLSNANLKLPNRGINTVVGLIGYSWGGMTRTRARRQ